MGAGRVNNADRTEDELLEFVAEGIRLAYEEPDPYMRAFFSGHVFALKWKRAAAMQGRGCGGRIDEREKTSSARQHARLTQKI